MARYKFHLSLLEFAVNGYQFRETSLLMCDQLQTRKHIRYLVRHLNIFPNNYSSLDTTKITLFYFAISGLDLLGELDASLKEGGRKRCIDWIYSMQLTSQSGCPPDACGFKGSGGNTQPINGYDRANLAQTYSALLSLLILDDDISRVDRKAILEAIRLSQRENGCFWSQGNGSESDMRFVFCAVAVCHIFNDFSPINWKTLRSFIRSSMTYDGGIGQGENAEAHGGSTFCAIAALSLSGRLWDESILTQAELTRLIKWAILKQEIGFHGRTGKPDDTCYAFWIGATLKILNAYHLCASSSVRQFLLSTQHNHMGGFSKLCEDGAYPDMLHTYFSLAALSLQGEPTLRSLHPALNISERVYGKLGRISQVDSLVL